MKSSKRIRKTNVMREERERTRRKRAANVDSLFRI